MATETVTDFSFKDATQARIPLSKIRENAEALRVSVDREDPDYLELVDSVRKRGVMNAILVREIRDPASGETLFGLIDGLHRFNAAMDAGLTEIPATIGSLDEANLLEAQMIANVHKIETKPVQYTKAILKIMSANPLMTILELGDRLSRGEQWIKDRLGLLKLKSNIQELVDKGELGLTNAYSLSKLPEEQQEEMLSSAIGKSPAEFVPQANATLNEIKKARREGRAPKVDDYIPTPRFQKFPTVNDERELLARDPAQSKLVAEMRAANVTTVEAAAAYALNWVLKMDPVTVERDRAAWTAQKEADKAEKERKKQEKEAQKQQQSATAAAK